MGEGKIIERTARLFVERTAGIFPFFSSYGYAFAKSYDKQTRLFFESVRLYTAPQAYDALHIENLDSESHRRKHLRFTNSVLPSKNQKRKK